MFLGLGPTRAGPGLGEPRSSPGGALEQPWRSPGAALEELWSQFGCSKIQYPSIPKSKNQFSESKKPFSHLSKEKMTSDGLI